MPTSSSYRRRVAARARTLHERLRTPVDDSDALDEDGDDWLSRWNERVADGDPATFEGRLELAVRSVEECRRSLRSREVPDDQPPPEWTDRLDHLLAFVESRESAGSRLVEAADDAPFVHALAPLVAFASERVAWDSFADSLSERARLDLELWLLDRLSRLSAHALFIEFKTFLASRDRELALADDPEMPDEPRRYYDRFVADLFEGELRSLFEEYATLARMSVTLSDQWVDAVEQFGTDLRADRDALAETFPAAEPLGRVTDLDHHGDPHQGGRVVFHVTFESGLELAYKPRDVGAEARFADLVSWVNAESDLPDLEVLDCLNRDDHGWMEWAQSASCESPEAVGRYYRRAGSLVCLLYALNFTDGHLENVVAAGEYPVVVDLETVMHPDLPLAALPTTSELPELQKQSVLRTGLLPVDSANSDLQNIAGFGSPEGERTGVQVPTFERVNTDVMELRYEDTQTLPGDSLPRFDGSRVEPDEYADALADGFAEAYRFLLDRRETLLADDGPLAGFADAELRLLYRPTHTYLSVLTPLTTPEYLRDGRTFGCKVERLARPFAAGDADRRMWPVFEAERTALWRADVPRFSVRADDTTLRHDGDPVVDCFETSPLERARQRIAELSEFDLEEQLDFVELAYEAEVFSPPSVESSPGDEATSGDLDVHQCQRAIYERLRETATETADGTLTWHRYEGTRNGVRLEPVGDDLYRGRIGIAAYCGALAATTGEREYREFAARVGSEVASEFDGDEPFADLQVGAGAGIGSLAYGFAVLGDLLDGDEFAEAARRTGALLTPERFAADTDADVMGGNAGAVLSLLALHDQLGDDDLLDRAVAAGERLLAERVELADCAGFDGVRAWHTTAGEQVLAGMAHGVAGIAHALVKLSAATGDRRFREAAVEALDFEDDAYSAEARNWRDYRPAAVADYVTDWCGGRAGIGLARLGAYEATRDEAFLRDVERALDGTDHTGLEDLDHLCCGNCSRVDFLLRAGRTLDEPRYCEQARELATATVRRADEAGRFTVPGQTDHWFNPSLFRGELGIGYTLLRLDHSELPCVTLWE
jgi:type 2 lantibiotic biosynthesis protein LanM